MIRLDLNVQGYGKCHSRSYAYATKPLTHDFKIKRIKILARVCLLYIDKKCFSLYF